MSVECGSTVKLLLIGPDAYGKACQESLCSLQGGIHTKIIYHLHPCSANVC